MVTQLEPDILECEVKWALGSITMNKASGGDGTPAELFQILKMMLLNCYPQYFRKFGKLSSGHRSGKGQLFQSQKAMPTENFQTYKLSLEKAKRSNCKHSLDHKESILAWRIPWTEKPGRLQSTRLQRVGLD